jgi:bifunctional DNA-binding transcriptional regulator/antitoxin component of YhaV-PrlF toxin-antitoxin module
MQREPPGESPEKLLFFIGREAKATAKNKRSRLDFKGFPCILLFMTQTKISKAFQTTISAEAIRALGFRPGRRVNQMVDGRRLILELAEDADALAGSLGKSRRPHSVNQMKAAGKKAFAEAGAAGLEEAD